MREIGSEFWEQYPKKEMHGSDSTKYLASGRTALDFIIKDALCERTIYTAYLPAYCCESMILPFVQAGIKVKFYQVNGMDVDYPYGNDADIVFLIDFFGYINPQNSEIARREKAAGKIIIYDATHKIDGNAEVQAYADYSFCSYRKWFYCNYAQAVKHHGVFNDGEVLTFNQRYVNIRDKAAREKNAYMAGRAGEDEKESFLAQFREAEAILDEDYVGYAGVPVAFDLEEIVSKRRENAAYLIRELKKFPQIKLWQDTMGPQDAPLFVPILVHPSVRQDLRSALIKEKIYCPIHWPRSSYHSGCHELYDTELSLICDQRYDISDMARIICVIKEFFTDKR